MKMMLTRQGFNSKMVVTGDVTQIDLPAGKRSGLLEAVDVLRGVEGISFVQFDERDVVRHTSGAAHRQGVRAVPASRSEPGRSFTLKLAEAVRRDGDAAPDCRRLRPDRPHVLPTTTR